MEKYLFRKFNQIIAVSKEDQEFIKQKYEVENCVCIYNGF